MAWSAQKNTNFGSTEVHFFALPGTDTVFVVYYDGAGNVKIQKSVDGGNTFAAAVTIASTLSSGDVMLNEPVAYDPTVGTNGRLFVAYGHNIDDVSNKGVLLIAHSDDLGATWTSDTLDDGTAHTGLDSFYRVGVWAYNGSISVHWTYESNSTFTTDGLWRRTGTYTTGAVTWAAAAKVYTGTVVGAYEPNVAGFADGTVICSYYDDGLNQNKPGDIWIAKSSDHGQTWSAAPTKITSTKDYGRPRIVGENGVWWIVANKPWNSSPQIADVYTLTSTDNGATWGTPIKRIANGGFSLDHPDVAIQGNFVGILCRATPTGSTGHSFIYSTDGGNTFSSISNPLGDSTTSDAPRLHITNSYLIATGYDSVNTRSMWAMDPEWFSVLPGTQTAVIDNFNGYTAGTLLSGGTGGWTQTALGGEALKATGTAIVRKSGAGTFSRAGSYHSGVYTGNCEAWITVSDADTEGEADVFIWDPVNKNGYDLMFSNGGWSNPAVAITKYAAGAGSALANNTARNLTTGDQICLQIVGTQVICWYKPSGGAWTEEFRVVENTYRSALQFEIEIAGQTQAAPTVDDFGGGALSAPASTSLPSISGSPSTGQILQASPGGWSNAPVKYRYQWKRDGAAITGAVLPSYTVAAGDMGHTLSVDVTAANAVGSTVATAPGVLAALATFLPHVHGGAYF